MNLTLITPPAAEPVSLQEAKDHLRLLEEDAEDALLAGWIAAAREYVEIFTRRQLVTATWRLTLGAFPGVRLWRRDPDGLMICRGEDLHLPKGRLQSISSVQYVDAGGTLQTLAADDYQVRLGDDGLIRPRRGNDWPQTDGESPEAVRIEFVAGYGDADDVPASIKAAVKLLVGHWFENRQAVSADRMAEAPLAVQSLLWSVRLSL